MDNYDVAYGASPLNLTTDEICRFDFYISNDSAEPIIFSNEEKLKPEDYPAYDDPVLEGSPSGFYVYFKYGDKNSDLVEKADSVNIDFSIKLGDHWNILQSVSPTIGQYWRICPKETTVMEPGDQLIVAVENVKCNKAFGMTALFVELRTEGSIFKDRLNFYKYDKPEIKTFGIKETDYDIGDQVTFQWRLDKADGCEVTINGKNVSGKEEQLLEVENKHYVLEVKNPAFYSVTSTCSPSFIFIESFDVNDYYPDSITLQWVTRNSSYCEIEGLGRVEPTGTMTVPSDSKAIKSYCFTFILHPKESTDPEIKELEFVYPIITEFRLDDYYNQTHKMKDADTLEMNPDQPFVSILEIDKHMTIASVCRPYDSHPDPPPECWHYGLWWAGTNVEQYELVGYGFYKGQNRRIERNENERHFTLKAYGKHNIVYDEREI